MALSRRQGKRGSRTSGQPCCWNEAEQWPEPRGRRVSSGRLSVCWRHRCSLQVGPTVGIPATLESTPWLARAPWLLELCCPCSLPVDPTTSLQTLNSQLPPWGPPSGPSPIYPLRAPKAAPSLSPFCTGGNVMCETGGASRCEPGRGGGADISPRLTHHVPPPLWPGCTPRLSLFPRALLRVPLSLPWGPVDSLQLPLVPVLMFSGCLNKAPQSGSFKHQKITSSHFWRVEVWDQGVNSDFFWRLANDCPPPLSLHDLSSHMAPTPQAQNVFPRCHLKHMTGPCCRMWVIPRLLVFLLTSPQGVSSSQCPTTQLSPSDHSHCCGPWKRGSGLRMSTVTFTSPCPMALLSPPPTSEFSSHHL